MSQFFHLQKLKNLSPSAILTVTITVVANIY